jgi:SAM-dependent methyltransferase
MGRFAEIVAKYGGTVVGVDLSYAVEPAAKNLAPWPNAHVLQGDLRRLPLKKGVFDLVYSLGVLHHTPNPRSTFEGLLPYVKPGGLISITLYSGYNRVYVASTNAWRVVTTRLPPKLVYYLSHLAIPAYFVYKIPVLGLIGKAIWPISLHPDPEWRVLDTLDCYTPKYQAFYAHPEVFRWFKDAGLEEIEVLEPGISFIGRAPVRDSFSHSHDGAAGSSSETLLTHGP